MDVQKQIINFVPKKNSFWMSKTIFWVQKTLQKLVAVLGTVGGHMSGAAGRMFLCQKEKPF